MLENCVPHIVVPYTVQTRSNRNYWTIVFFWEDCDTYSTRSFY